MTHSLKTIAAAFLCTLAICFGLAGVYASSAHAENMHRCVGRTATADGHETSCQFANNVWTAWFQTPGNPVLAYSPITGVFYSMVCVRGFDLAFDDGIVVYGATRCMDATGGTAVAYVW